MLDAEYFYCRDQVNVQIRNKSFLAGVNEKQNLEIESPAASGAEVHVIG
jgi:hypothetical protein